MAEQRLLNGGNLIHTITRFLAPDAGSHRSRRGETLCGQIGSTWSLDVWGGGAPKTPCPKCHKEEDKT